MVMFSITPIGASTAAAAATDGLEPPGVDAAVPVRSSCDIIYFLNSEKSISLLLSVSIAVNISSNSSSSMSISSFHRASRSSLLQSVPLPFRSMSLNDCFNDPPRIFSITLRRIMRLSNGCAFAPAWSLISVFSS